MLCSSTAGHSSGRESSESPAPAALVPLATLSLTSAAFALPLPLLLPFPPATITTTVYHLDCKRSRSGLPFYSIDRVQGPDM